MKTCSQCVFIGTQLVPMQDRKEYDEKGKHLYYCGNNKQSHFPAIKHVAEDRKTCSGFIPQSKEDSESKQRMRLIGE